MIPTTPLIVSTVRHATGILTQLLGLAALAALLAAAAAIAFRQYADQPVPRWLALLVGPGAVVIYLGTTPVLEMVVREGIELTEAQVGLFNLAGVAAGAVGALAGRRVGDQFVLEVLRWTPTQTVDEGVSDLAQTVGQVTTVRLPPSIDDAIGYDPVPDRTKERLAGATFVFPRTLTTAELEDRLDRRLRTDYGVEAVDAEIDGDSVRYLAVGRRAAGIGSTLPAATNAIAVRADPAFSASTGDIVQVWEPETMRRVLTGELRGVADDVVTIAIDATDTPKVDPTRRYRLVTLPVEDRPDREFASLLRAAQETFSSATVEAGSPLHGMPVGALALTVVAVRPEETEPVVFPEGSYGLQPGDRLFVIGTAPELRRLDRAGEPLDPSLVGPPPSTPAEEPPAEGIETADPPVAEPEDAGSGEPARIGSDTIEPEEGAAATDQPGDPPTASSETAEASGAGGSQIEGKASESRFDELKEEFDENDEPVEAEESGEPDAVDSGAASFDELRDEFESGDADWDEDDEDDEDPFDDVEIAFEEDEDEDQSEDTGGDELVSLENADISFEDDADDEEGGEEDDQSMLGEPEIDEELQGEDESSAGDLMDLDDDSGDDLMDLGEETDDDLSDLGAETDDDLSDLEFDEDEDDSIFEDESLEDDSVFGDDEEHDSDNESDDEDDGEGDSDDDDDDDGGGGGGKSFAELKDEFESGDAEWEEDVSDSPGGDMRLDE